MKKLIIIALLIAAAITGLVLLGKDKPTDTSNNTTQTNPAARTYGTGSLKVIEYGDFQCPGCGSFYPLVKQIKETYKDKISFEFKHFPLQTIHPNARAAHRAGQAAANQNKFWEMHDLLYENQTGWNSSSNASSIFEQFATQLGLNMDQFKADVASSTTNSLINADVEEGGKAGVTGTPTFFIDGKEVDTRDIDSVEKFSKLLDDRIQAKTTEPPADL